MARQMFVASSSYVVGVAQHGDSTRGGDDAVAR